MKFKAFLMPWGNCPERAFGIHCIIAEYLSQFKPSSISFIIKALGFPDNWTIIDYADYIFDCYAIEGKWYLYKNLRSDMYERIYKDTLEFLATI